VIDPRKRHELPTLGTLFGREVSDLTSGPLPDFQKLELLEQYWPEVFDSSHGGSLTDSDASTERLEGLFSMFGLPLKVQLNSPEVLGFAYDVCAQSLGFFVRKYLRDPERFEALMDDWPREWVAYIRAVATDDKKEAGRLAATLGVMRFDCKYPPGVLMFSPCPPEMGAVLDTLAVFDYFLRTKR